MKKTRDIHHFWLFPKQPRIYQCFINFLSIFFQQHFCVSFFYHFFQQHFCVSFFHFFQQHFWVSFFFIFSFFYSSIFWYHFFIICSSNLCWNHVLTILWISERITLCMYVSVQIRAGPAKERGRVCRFNEPSDEVAFLNLRTSGFFWVGSSTVWVFFCLKLRFWNYFFSDCLEHIFFSIQSCIALTWK